jgi:hypothetical protein
MNGGEWYYSHDHGQPIILGRGLDIFQKPDDKFTLGFLDQRKRKCKATTITYIRSKQVNSIDGPIQSEEIK